MRILIVDDNPEDRWTYRRLLDRAAPGVHEFLEAGTGEQGLELCLSARPDCILLDFHLPDQDGIEVLDALVGEGGSPDVALVMITGQGDERIAVEAMKRGAHDYLVKGKVTADALERAIRNAGEKVALRQELEQKRRALLESNRELERFACTVAHDLQNPLTSLMHAMAMLGELQQGRLDPPSVRLVEAVHQQIQRMRVLIRGLLEFSRLDGRRQQFSPVDCAALLLEVRATLEALIREHDAEVRGGPLPVVQGHPLQLSMVLQNLVANAIKYRGPDRPVVQVEAHDEGDHWRLGVRDNGVGIPPEFQQEVFEPLRRLHSHAEVPGTGLGLAICKKIVEYHGGRIWLESQPGVGTVVWFTLPAPAAARR